MRLLIHIFISQCNLFFSLNLHKNCKKKFLPTNITGQKIKFYEEKKLQKLELPRYLYSPNIRPSLTVNCFFFLIRCAAFKPLYGPVFRVCVYFQTI